MTSNIHKLPPLHGLILSGGKSSRMGKDKALLTYHALPQIKHLINLLGSLCEQVFVSTKHVTDYPKHPVITDQYDIESPLNGILSALTQYPKSVWLVIACDMPYIDSKSIEYLMSHRTVDKLATCYINQKNLIEPLFSIWEPSVLPLLIDFHNNDERSPKKFLSTNEVNCIKPQDFKVLTNVNTLEEYNKVKGR